MAGAHQQNPGSTSLCEAFSCLLKQRLLLCKCTVNFTADTFSIGYAEIHSYYSPYAGSTTVRTIYILTFRFGTRSHRISFVLLSTNRVPLSSCVLIIRCVLKCNGTVWSFSFDFVVSLPTHIQSRSCSFRWRFRFDEHENFFKHTSHAYGFSPVCVRWCSSRLRALSNIFVHVPHRYGF